MVFDMSHIDELARAINYFATYHKKNPSYLRINESEFVAMLRDNDLKPFFNHYDDRVCLFEITVLICNELERWCLS